MIPNGTSTTGSSSAPAPPLINVQSDSKPTTPQASHPSVNQSAVAQMKQQQTTNNVLSATSVSAGALAASGGALSSNPFSLNLSNGRSLDLSINTVPGG